MWAAWPRSPASARPKPRAAHTWLRPGSVAEVASAILAGESIGAQLETIGNRVALATAAGRARVVLEPVPAAMPDEITVALHARAGNAWLYLTADVTWDQSAIERVA